MEKKYLNFKVHSIGDNQIKTSLRLAFKNAQSTFDKSYRKYKRLHKKAEFLKLESDSRKNPSEMWAALKRLSNPPSAKTALEIVRADGSISRETQEILSIWFKDISRLYSGLHDDLEMAYDEDFYSEVIRKKADFESLRRGNPLEDENTIMQEFNEDIRYDER